MPVVVGRTDYGSRRVISMSALVRTLSSTHVLSSNFRWEYWPGSEMRSWFIQMSATRLAGIRTFATGRSRLPGLLRFQPLADYFRGGGDGGAADWSSVQRA